MVRPRGGPDGELTRALARGHKDEDSASREAWRLERTLTNLRAIRPALDALVCVMRAVIDAAPLTTVWDTLYGFLKRWLLPPGSGAPVMGLLADAMTPACAGRPGKALTGSDALRVIEERLLDLRLPEARFGQPAVYVGTVAGAAGLEFSAVRVLGLCEGVLPSEPHEDPVLPGALTAALELAQPGRVLPTAEDHVAAQNPRAVHGRPGRAPVRRALGAARRSRPHGAGARGCLHRGCSRARTARRRDGRACRRRSRCEGAASRRLPARPHRGTRVPNGASGWLVGLAQPRSAHRAGTAGRVGGGARTRAGADHLAALPRRASRRA